ncbi:AraC family transcriptional regulator [Massilia sp. Root418]|uniref:AraC family transcriptional regulator ligand-binding domain-containing protein n=1 Tax=Massilia sp. Root418 TaxID=1736532 RepID=UPI0007001DB6|nr:AraC family transcriptional regulator ligand-binding domain-containing protein [Massilia sp. Root418]KQX01496.1 AraC family transcriptional regulator [Massilia sp. Root418]
MIAYHGAADAVIPARHQPWQVLDYAASRDAALPALWRGTGLDGPELPPADLRLAPQQYLQLLQNAARMLDSADTAFMLGQQMLPGDCGAASAELLRAPSLRAALHILVEHGCLLSPLLCPRFRTEGGLAALYWTDSYGAPGQLPFLAEMHMTALAAMCRWLSGERLPWRFCFNRTRPRHTEQHEVHLGTDLRFDCHLDAMLIDAAWLDRPWPAAQARTQAMEQAMEQATAQPTGQPSAQASAPAGAPPITPAPSAWQSATPSLLSALYDYLLARVRAAPSLEQTAADFAVSPATLKRHLARHNTHFQAELDQVRTHVALYLFQTRRADNDAVAEHLGFHDATNFRRSFKRWTGQTPGLLRETLLAGAN